MLHLFFQRLTNHVPQGELGRYLLVGIWNTVFAYGTFALFTALLAPHVPASYMAGGVLSACSTSRYLSWATSGLCSKPTETTCVNGPAA